MFVTGTTLPEIAFNHFVMNNKKTNTFWDNLSVYFYLSQTYKINGVNQKIEKPNGKSQDLF